MKRKLLMLVSSVMIMGIPMAASATQYDVAVSESISPVASPKQVQDISFIVTNVGEQPVESFLAGATQNGKKIVENRVFLDAPLKPGESVRVTLDTPVELEYGFTDKIEVYAQLTDVSDDDSSNNTLSYEVAMPWLQDFPYTWSDADAPTDFTWPDPWTFSPTAGTFYYFGTKPKLTSDITSGVFDMGDETEVRCSFVYNCTDVVDVTVLAWDGDTETELGQIRLPGNGKEYDEGVVFGKVSGLVQFKIRLSFPERPTSYVSVNLSNIDFMPAGGVDMSAKEILSPSINKIALGDKVNVSARFENVSASAIVNPVFCWSADGKEVKEAYVGVVASGQSVDYTFRQQLAPSLEGKSGIKVWCEVKGDTDASNNTLQSGEITYYAPMTFPYKTEFDTGNELWSIIDIAGKGWTWEFGTLDDGNNILGYHATYGTYDDIAISPAVALPTGKSRLSFYYSGLSGGTHLKVMYGKTPNVADMTEVLFDSEVDQNGWRQGYCLMDVKESGNYYFAFHLTGAHDQLLVDKLSIDNEEDMCIGQVSFDTSSGFNLSESKVSVALMNHGLSPQSGIEVAYFLDNGVPVKETVRETLNPGETIIHTFAKPVDISKAGETYRVTGQIITEVGSDRFNDISPSEPLYHYANQPIPYYFNFSDPFRSSQWKMSSSSSQAQWSIKLSDGDYMNTNGNYDGYGSIRFTNTGYDDNDAWAFSECMEIPAGTYELSYFYRTSPNWDMDAYRQNFRLMLGNAQTAESMTIEMSRHENILESGGYKKYNGTVTIPEDGKYYIGLHAFGSRRSGYIQFDALSLSPVSEPKTIPYEADFAHRADEWYHYNPGAWNTQWVYSEQSGAMVADRVSGGNESPDGMLVSPALFIKAGDKAELRFSYSLTGEPSNITFKMYVASVNNPDSFTLVKSCPMTDKIKEICYELEDTAADREVYIGFRTVHDYDPFLVSENAYTASLYSMSLKGKDIGISGPEADAKKMLRRAGDIITADDEAAVITVSDLTGRVVAYGTGSVSIAGLQGVHIVMVKSAEGKKAFKHIF